MSQPSWCTAAEHIGNKILGWSLRPPPHPRPDEPCISPWSVVSSPCHLSPDGERPDEAVDGAVAAPVGRAVGHRAEHGAAESLWTRDIITPGHVSLTHLCTCPGCCPPPACCCRPCWWWRRVWTASPWCTPCPPPGDQSEIRYCHQPIRGQHSP